MESDLISRSELRKGLEMRYMTELYPEWRTLSLGMKEKIGRLAGAFRKAIDSAPALDAVQVVRCKECYYLAKERESLYCTYHDNMNVTEEFFCSTGEVKDNGHQTD